MSRKPHLPGRGVLAALLLLAPLACERTREQAQPEAPARTAAGPDTALYPVEVEPGIALAVRKTGSREYMMYGQTDRATELRLSVEDGHNILFGPTEVVVSNGRFRVDFVIEPTERDHIFLYLTDYSGDRLAVVPVDTARALTTAGPPEAIPEAPTLPAGSPPGGA